MWGENERSKAVFAVTDVICTRRSASTSVMSSSLQFVIQGTSTSKGESRRGHLHACKFNEVARASTLVNDSNRHLRLMHPKIYYGALNYSLF